MKSKLIYSLALFILAASIKTSAHLNSIVNFKFSDRSQFVLEFDNQKFRTSNRDISLDNIKAGKHKVKVFKYTRNLPYPSLVYNGFVDIPSATKVYIDFNYRNMPVIVRVEPIVHANNAMQNSYHNNHFHNSHNNRNFTKQDLKQLILSMKHISFDSDKLKIAKRAIKNKDIKSLDVGQILNTFHFESNKLKFAKHAYRYTLDKQNYFLVIDALQFQNSRRELAIFVH